MVRPDRSKASGSGYLEQEPKLDPDKDVRGNVEEGIRHIKGLLEEFDEVTLKFAEPLNDDEMTALLERQGQLQDAIDASDAWELDRKLDIAADALRLPPVGGGGHSSLGWGEAPGRTCADCWSLHRTCCCWTSPPTTWMRSPWRGWSGFFRDYPGTVVAITHDRYFLDNAAGWILELDRGRGIPWKGNYTSWLEQKEQRLAMEERQEASRQRTIKAELEWVRSNPQARRSKSKARLAQFEELNSREVQSRSETKEIYIPPGPRLGDLVIEAKSLVKQFADRVLVSDLNMLLPKGGIAGVVGPNGAGKSTLLKMIAGLESPDGGELRLGETVELAYVDQSREALDGNKTVWEEISDGQDNITIGKYQIASRAYVGRFNFKGSDQEKRVGDLSGGERNRLNLAKLLRQGANLLLLDEPTNDLDVETMRALEEAILGFPGSAVVVTHDRWFLDRIATHILAFESDSTTVWFEGNYSEYETDRRRRLGDDAHQPHRIKYRALTG